MLLAACSLGGLAATHNITLLFLPPVLLGYLALLWFTDRRPLALRWRSLGWAALAGLLAMGISAFFWLPLVVERTYLTDIPFRISATFIAENVWTWTNFLDWRFPFEYSLVPPFQLGFVQLGLAILGFVLVRPRSAEWWYWAGVFVVMAIGISILTLELWLNVKLLLIAQFPWRLLGIASVPLALFAGGAVVRLRPGWPQLAVAAGLMLVIILGQRPLPSEFEQMVTNDAQVTPANAAQFEQDTKAYGTSMASEFFPSWADDFNVETLAGSVSQRADAGHHPAQRHTVCTDSRPRCPGRHAVAPGQFLLPWLASHAGRCPIGRRGHTHGRGPAGGAGAGRPASTAGGVGGHAGATNRRCAHAAGLAGVGRAVVDQAAGTE